MFDCIIEVGHLTEGGYRYLDDESHRYEVVKCVATVAEAVEWYKSPDTLAMCRRMSDGGRLDVTHHFGVSADSRCI